MLGGSCVEVGGVDELEKEAATARYETLGGVSGTL